MKEEWGTGEIGLGETFEQNLRQLSLSPFRFTSLQLSHIKLFRYGPADQTFPHHSVHFEQLCRRCSSYDWRTHVRM